MIEIKACKKDIEMLRKVCKARYFPVEYKNHTDYIAYIGGNYCTADFRTQQYAAQNLRRYGGMIVNKDILRLELGNNGLINLLCKSGISEIRNDSFLVCRTDGSLEVVPVEVVKKQYRHINGDTIKNVRAGMWYRVQHLGNKIPIQIGFQVPYNISRIMIGGKYRKQDINHHLFEDTTRCGDIITFPIANGKRVYSEAAVIHNSRIYTELKLREACAAYYRQSGIRKDFILKYYDISNCGLSLNIDLGGTFK